MPLIEILKHRRGIIGGASIPVSTGGWFKFQILYNDRPNYKSMLYLIENRNLATYLPRIQDDAHFLFASKQFS